MAKLKILAGTLSAATKLQDAQGSDRNLSKVLTLGTDYRIFFPLAQDPETGDYLRDVALAVVPGRRLDYDALGKSFIVLNDFEVTDMDKIIDKSGLAAYSRISSVLYEAEYRAERQRLERQAIADADALGKEVDKIGLEASLRKLDVEFHGDDEAKPNKIYPERSKLIGNPVLEIATRVLVVPLDAKGAPEFAKAVTAILPISGTKKLQLASILSSDDYMFDPTRSFLEVGYSYKGTDKNQAGRTASLQGISRDTSLETKFPDIWTANKDQLGRLSNDPEVIASKNLTMTSNVTTGEIIDKFMKYVSKHEILLAHLDYNDELTKSTARDMVELGIADGAPAIKDKLIELASSVGNTEEAEDTDEQTAPSAVIDAAGVTSLSELDSKISEDIDDIIGDPIDSI